MPAANIGYTNWAVWLIFTYIWLPFMILPIYGALERVPDSFLEASRDLGAGGWTTFRRVLLPLALPGVIAGSIFTFSLTLGDYITPLLAGGASSQFIGNVVYDNINNQLIPFAAAFATVPLAVMAVSRDRTPARRVRCALMETRGTRIALRVWSTLVVAFLWFPLALIMLYAFNSSNVESWPISGFTTHWFHEAWTAEVRTSLWLSIKVGLIATAIALVLGSMAAFGVARFRFFGREAISFLFVLPIALPGIVTGIALNSAFTAGHVNLSIWTIVIGHATFCVVLIYNNVLARLRRSSPSLIEASQDLGADGWQTFRFVVWPVLSTALVAGGLLAFALSFDEVIVTTFTAGVQNTLPLLILGYIRVGQQLPVVNVIAFAMIVFTAIPVVIAQRLMRDTGVIRRGPAKVTEAVETSQITAY
jgi:putative spermidine/putrescine transport system permease protein